MNRRLKETFSMTAKCLHKSFIGLSMLILLVQVAQAQTSLYAEGADISITINDPTFVISSAGTYTVSGNLSTPGDGQDYFQITVNSGLQLTNATYSVSGGSGFNGGWGFAGCCGNTISGNGSGSFSGAAYPLSAGTYGVQMFASFSVGNSWVTTFTVTATASAPSITANPPNRTICAGSNTTFTVSANNATGYQWQLSTNSGFTYSNISNSGVYSGATTATLAITGATTGMNNYRYRCVVSGAIAPNATSSHGTLTVNSTPSITTNPPDRTICAGSNTTFTVSANNASSYQWQMSTNNGVSYFNVSNGGVYSGATTATLAITGATTGMNNYRYRCVASGSCTPSATSSHGTLTVNSVPFTSGSTINNPFCEGTASSFSYSVNNATSNQWQLSTNGGGTWSNVTNGGIYSGATTATLSISNKTASMNGYRYRLVMINSCGSANTSTTTLSALSGPAITGQPGNSTICDGSNTSFSVTATGAGLTYQWQVSTNGGGTWTNLSNTGIYSTVTSATLNLTGATTAVNSNQYRCVVSGTCTPGVTSNAATLTINTLPSISVQPVNSTICASNNTSFSVTASGTGVSYQWQVSTNGGATFTNLANGGIYSNVTTATLNLTAATAGENNNQYRCVISGTCTPSVTSTARTLTVNTAPNITGQPVNSTICDGSNTSFSVTTTGAGLTYQWQVSTNGGGTWTNLTNTGIYSTVTSATLNLTGATTAENNNQYRCVVGGTCVPGVTSNAATLTINTLPSISVQPVNSTICAGNNTSFSVTASGTGVSYQWQVSTNGGATFTNLTNTGIYSNVTTATLNLTAATAGENNNQYRCVVSGTCTPSVTSTARTLTVNTAPNITAQPSNISVCEGSNGSFSVTATGAALTYQWQVSTNGGGTWSNLTNTGIYSTVTTATLNLTAVNTAVNNYQYRCVISGTCTPSTTSNAGTLTIDTKPVVTVNPINSTICEGSNTSFSVTATGTALSYQWQVSTNGGGYIYQLGKWWYL
ncbi:MAG: hypothetical protein R2800_03885 [Flavipsychrobacter sp.]